jgi:hypothetical protein
MNRYRTTGVPASAALREAAFSSSGGLKIALITLDNCTASGAVYPALTAIRKDCGDNRQKAARRAFGAIKADVAFASAAMLARVKYGNGDLAWL